MMNSSHIITDSYIIITLETLANIKKNKARVKMSRKNIDSIKVEYSNRNGPENGDESNI